MSKIELPASFMLFFILPRKLQTFCNVFSSILYTYLTYQLGCQKWQILANQFLLRHLFLGKHGRVVEIGQMEDSYLRLLITTWSDHVETRIQSGTPRQSGNFRQMVNHTYRSYRTKIPNGIFRNFFINGKQPICLLSWRLRDEGVARWLR